MLSSEQDTFNMLFYILIKDLTLKTRLQSWSLSCTIGSQSQCLSTAICLHSVSVVTYTHKASSGECSFQQEEGPTIDLWELSVDIRLCLFTNFTCEKLMFLLEALGVSFSPGFGGFKLLSTNWLSFGGEVSGEEDNWLAMGLLVAWRVPLQFIS
ncbi:hypothetical protein NE237_020394 [Protea cynaroides]|uniref:Uncharacterized protein n=1 Tax=Protea cynaroides TaxID=273540 RepID=A0A9Q0K1L6_9MAGN|nr:hypothetical protein NE237_020394 [Protea cynaroides]